MQAEKGGAIGMGPMSKLFLLTPNFTGAPLPHPCLATLAAQHNTHASGGSLPPLPWSLAALSPHAVPACLCAANTASKWGDDIFMASPVGSTIYLNKWPASSVAKIFPPQSSASW